MENLNFEWILDEEFTEIKDEFTRVAYIQKRMSEHFSFENLDVLLNDSEDITKAFIYEKLIEKRRGGVCYELNGLLYLILRSLDYHVRFAVATVWSPNGWVMDRTHTIILWEHADGLYLIDSGSGNNLTLQPMLIDGKKVTSPAGTFRVRTHETERGTVLAEKQEGKHWTKRYAFYLDEVGWDDMNRVKRLIQTDPASPFLDDILVARIVSDGTISINSEQFRHNWSNGTTETNVFQSEQQLFEKLEEYATESVVSAVRMYLKRN